MRRNRGAIEMSHASLDYAILKLIHINAVIALGMLWIIQHAACSYGRSSALGAV